MIEAGTYKLTFNSLDECYKVVDKGDICIENYNFTLKLY